MYHKIIKQSDVIKWSKNLMNLLMKIITVNIYTFKWLVENKKLQN